MSWARTRLGLRLLPGAQVAWEVDSHQTVFTPPNVEIVEAQTAGAGGENGSDDR